MSFDLVYIEKMAEIVMDDTINITLKVSITKYFAVHS